MFDNQRSDFREKARRVSRITTKLRHNPIYIGRRHNFYSTVTPWLKAQIGRPWNDVRADICARFDSRSYTGKEIRDAVLSNWRVEQNCYISIDNNVRETNSYHIVRGLYVHPETGILSFAPEYPRHPHRRHSKKFDPDKDTIPTDGGFYQYLECGVVSKRPSKNRTKAWFYFWDEVETYQYWHSDIQGYDEFYYSVLGCVKGEFGDWGRWRTGEHIVTHKESCNHEQVAWIKNFIRQ